MPEGLTETILSGRDLDAAVAERVLGWTRYSKAVEPSDNRTINGVLYCPPNFPESNFGGLNSVPCYSGDMAAAMAVVEKMREQGWSFACTLYEGELPYSSFCKRTVASSRNAEANTLPEAICLAALRAMGSDKS